MKNIIVTRNYVVHAELLPYLFDHMHNSTPDLPVAYTIKELALCRDESFTFLSTSVEMSQVIEYLCTI